MADYLRTFTCRDCKTAADLDDLSEDIYIIECKECGKCELWTPDSDGVELFITQDLAFAEC